MTGTSYDVHTGIAQFIAAAGVATFNPSGIYALSDTGVVMKIMPDGSSVPDRLVVLNAFPLLPNVTLPQDRWLLQIAYRGARNNPLDVDQLGDAVFNILHGAMGVQLGASVAAQILFSTSTPMGEDSLTRTIRADKYFVDVDVPPTNLRPAGGSWT